MLHCEGLSISDTYVRACMLCCAALHSVCIVVANIEMDVADLGSARPGVRKSRVELGAGAGTGMGEREKRVKRCVCLSGLSIFNFQQQRPNAPPSRTCTLQDSRVPGAGEPRVEIAVL